MKDHIAHHSKRGVNRLSDRTRLASCITHSIDSDQQLIIHYLIERLLNIIFALLTHIDLDLGQYRQKTTTLVLRAEVMYAEYMFHTSESGT